MPTDFFFNHCFDKKRLKAFILWSYSYNGGDSTIDIIEKMKEKGFHFATQAGISIGLDDLRRPPQKRRFLSQAAYQVHATERKCREGGVTDVERSQQLIDIWHRTSERLRQDVVDHFRATDILNPVYMMAFSGARGNISQVRQLTAMRGLMADPEGRIVGFPIRSSFREGLTLTEYMISCYGARKGLVDTALRTADAGYLTRRLVDVAHHVIVKGITCGTRQGIFLKEIQSGGKKVVSLEERLVGRVLAADIPLSQGEGLLVKRNQVVSDSLAMELASHSKEVLVRSPLKCAYPNGVCRLCYGWDLTRRKLVTVGEAVGIIAGQSIGEPGTQLTMRTFHTGGVFSGHLVDELCAPHPGVVHFPTPLQGLLIRTSHGRIAFLLKVAGECFLKQIDRKDESSMERNDDSQMDRSVIKNRTRLWMEASTILFVRQGEKVEKNALLAQFSSMEREANDTVEGIRIIFAQLAGQVASTQLEGQLQRVMASTRKKEADLRIDGSSPLQATWILAGSRPSLPDPEMVKIRLIEDQPSFPSVFSEKSDSRKSVRFSNLGWGSKMSLLLPSRPSPLRPVAPYGEKGQEAKGRGARVKRQRYKKASSGRKRAGRSVEVSITTMYHLHRQGGHLIDGGSLLAEVLYRRLSRTLFLQRGYTALSTIEWSTLPSSPLVPCGEGGASPPTPRAFQGEMARRVIDGEEIGMEAGSTLASGDQLNLSTGGRRPIVYVGQFLQAGQEIASNVAAPISGQVMRVRRGEVTLRRGEAILAYAGGRFYVEEREWVEGSTPIVALPYRQLIIDDIVQGIPKIEQLFEASKEKDGQPIKAGVQNRLVELFQSYTLYLPRGEAIRRSLEKIQEMLVEGISKVYLSQGVVIADKHLEIIIRQMTSKVEITTPGKSGLLGGECVSLELVGKINQVLPQSVERAVFRPAIVGITRTALQSNSFLSAASFQETTRVLAHHASSGKIDYLRGLKQHVIVGDLIPAGTGLDLCDRYTPLLSLPTPRGGSSPVHRWTGFSLENFSDVGKEFSQIDREGRTPRPN